MKQLLIPAIVLLAACSQDAPDNQAANDTAALNTEAPLNPPGPGEPGGLDDDRTPISEGAIDPKSAQGAGQVVQQYMALLEAGKRAEADALWSDSGTDAAFASRLANYREVHANIGAPGQPEGAAGSIYVDVPIQLYGRLNDGKEFNARGTMTLRRVNDVPGSTAEERQWHIYKTDFQ